MQTRFERYELKYFITPKEADRLRYLMEPFTEKDPFLTDSGRDYYTVRSVYFDTNDYVFYYEKESGNNVRKKLRIRSYDYPGEHSIASFEIKNKVGISLFKERALVPLGYVRKILDEGFSDEMIPGGVSSEEKNSLLRFLTLREMMRLEETVLVTYDREARVGRLNRKERVTFDMNVRCIIRPGIDELFTDTGFRYLPTDRIILELKFDGLMPAWMKRIVMELNLYSRPISKYCNCIDLWTETTCS
jgi:hypothetical protein